jgi:hypothetical protein
MAGPPPQPPPPPAPAKEEKVAAPSPAEAAGSPRSQEGIEQVVRKARKRKLPKRGRPRRIAAAQAPAGAGGIREAEALIEKLVQHRVREALDKIIAKLHEARKL